MVVVQHSSKRHHETCVYWGNRKTKRKILTILNYITVAYPVVWKFLRPGSIKPNYLHETFIICMLLLLKLFTLWTKRLLLQAVLQLNLSRNERTLGSNCLVTAVYNNIYCVDLYYVTSPNSNSRTSYYNNIACTSEEEDRSFLVGRKRKVPKVD